MQTSQLAFWVANMRANRDKLLPHICADDGLPHLTDGSSTKCRSPRTSRPASLAECDSQWLESAKDKVYRVSLAITCVHRQNCIRCYRGTLH